MIFADTLVTCFLASIVQNCLTGNSFFATPANRFSRYYMQAWHLFPNLGMPWNQVGTLMSNKYHGVFSLFFYRRCLQSESPYSDSFQNLKRMTDRAKKNYQIYPRNQMDNLSLGKAPCFSFDSLIHQMHLLLSEN